MAGDRFAARRMYGSRSEGGAALGTVGRAPDMSGRLVTYHPIREAHHPNIEALRSDLLAAQREDQTMVAKDRDEGDGLRDLVTTVVLSSPFRSK